MKNIATTLISLLALIAILLAVNIFYPISKRVPGALSKDEASQKAMDFINSVALQGQAAASLLDITEESGIYKIRLKIQDQEYDSYVTKDAKLLFGQATAIAEQSSDQSNEEAQEFPKSDTPEVRLFVMSFCPYGNQAEELMIPVANLLKDKAKIELRYVIYSNYQGGGKDYCLDEESQYCSMHGIQELNQGIRELCVQKYQKDKLWDFVQEINSTCNYQDVDACWEGAAKTLGIDVNKIKTCQKNEGLTISAGELALNEQYGISGSPQLIINGVEYAGARTSEGFKQAICSAFSSQPSECSQVLGNEGGSVSGGCE